MSLLVERLAKGTSDFGILSLSTLFSVVGSE